jgi:hypothetical protein
MEVWLMNLDDQTKKELVELLKAAVNEAVEAHPLSNDEVQWVRMAIKAEADRAALRKAIIEKSLAGLVWLALVSGGGYLVDFFVRHWK